MGDYYENEIWETGFERVGRIQLVPLQASCGYRDNFECGESREL
jgi:hypothetical protein